jgi:ferredoxin
MIFYFSATGNSLFVAKEIAAASGDSEVISIPQAIHQKDLSFSSERIGIVCPVFGHEMPPLVKEFLKKAQFNTDYFYIVETFGKMNGGCTELAANYCKEIGKTPSYINIVLMVDNFLPVFDMIEECREDKKVDEQIKPILEDIKAKKQYIRPVTDQERMMHQGFLSMASQMMPQDTSMYKFGNACNGCGICVKVCPAGCIGVEDGKAVQKLEGKAAHCQLCMACIHACPQKAIGLAMPMPERNPNARYRNSYVSVEEIIAANNQASY